MGKHIRKRFSDGEVKVILDRYLADEIGPEATQALLNIKRRQFFTLLKKYRQNPQSFSLALSRSSPTRQLPQSVEDKIAEALHKEYQLVTDKNNPIQRYNYSYVKTRLAEDQAVQVSLSTVIRRAQKKVFINRSPLANTTTEKCSRSM